MEFPSLKAPDLLAVLQRRPLDYVIVRQSGSHRRLESVHDEYPPIGFGFHDKRTVRPKTVREILVDEIGLTEEDALLAVKGKLK